MQFTLNFFLVLSVFSLAVAAAPAAEAINGTSSHSLDRWRV